MARSHASTDPVIQWLLAGDPSIQWQVHRDLLGADRRTVERCRERVAREGWGARMLASQDAEGTWGQGFYNPKWTSTHYTLLLLRDLGLPATNRQALAACQLLLANGLRADGGVNYGKATRSETCISGMTLSIVSYFGVKGPPVDAIADYILAQQLPDGGWNCRWPDRATHSSMHTTISALEGLQWYEVRGKRRLRDCRAARSRAHEFLLSHRLFRSHRTGTVIATAFTRFAFPPRWHYDVLRALDYLQSVDAARDPRLEEAIDLLGAKRTSDGRWPLEQVYAGKTWFALESPRAASRWNTLRALRVLKWWTS